MVIGLNTSSDLGGIINLIGEFVLGDVQMLGVWLLIVLLGLGLSFRIDFTLVLVFLIPVTIVLWTFGLVYPVIAGMFLLFDGFILAANFIFNR